MAVMVAVATVVAVVLLLLSTVLLSINVLPSVLIPTAFYIKN